MIEIDEPPDIRACAAHGVPLAWLWSPRSRGWKAYVPIDGDRDRIERHRCEYHGDPEPKWRQLELQTPETIHAGAALVRAELERAQREGDPQ